MFVSEETARSEAASSIISKLLKLLKKINLKKSVPFCVNLGIYNKRAFFVYILIKSSSLGNKGGINMLRDIIEQVQNNDNKAMLELIGRFKPIILKYAKRLGSEDAYEDVILYFIELAKTMELNRLASTNDEMIVSYIYFSFFIINQKREILFSSLTDEQSYYVEAQSAVYDKTDILTEYGILRCLNKKESSLSNIGLKNRGVKDGSGLYVIRKTKAKAILIEVCFCDNEKDVNIYLRSGAYEAAAQAIFKALSVPFDEFVGEIAHRDWIKRKIILPSVVTAQAIKESAWGKSELATQANALFGIKKNGWTGRTYIKTAVEQKADGSYYPVNNTEWRAYSSWEESIIDHNDYIATRTTDGGKTLRYAQIIGCEDYELTARGLQRCGYATSLTYADSLINDYIRKYNLLRFDEKI